MNKEKSNFERMIDLVEEIFSTRNDPEQLQVNEEVIEQLIQLDPHFVSELDEGKGPCCWILLIPSNTELMHRFLDAEITEQELFERSRTLTTFTTLYLASALTLPEYRNKGITFHLCISAILELQKKYSFQDYFAWTFTEEGKHLAAKISNHFSKPIHIRVHQP